MTHEKWKTHETIIDLQLKYHDFIKLMIWSWNNLWKIKSVDITMWEWNYFVLIWVSMKCPFLVAVFIIVHRPLTPIWHLHNPWNPSSAFVCCACYDSLSTAPWVQPHKAPLTGWGSGPVGEMAGPSRVDAKVAQYFHCWFFWSSSSGTTRCESGSLLLKSVSRGHLWWWHPLDSAQRDYYISNQGSDSV